MRSADDVGDTREGRRWCGAGCAGWEHLRGSAARLHSTRGVDAFNAACRQRSCRSVGGCWCRRGRLGSWRGALEVCGTVRVLRRGRRPRRAGRLGKALRPLDVPAGGAGESRRSAPGWSRRGSAPPAASPASQSRCRSPTCTRPAPRQRRGQRREGARRRGCAAGSGGASRGARDGSEALPPRATSTLRHGFRRPRGQPAARGCWPTRAGGCLWNALTFAMGAPEPAQRSRQPYWPAAPKK